MNINIIYLLQLMLRQAPVGIVGAIVFKGMFILFQVSSIWIVISWINGTIIPAAKWLVALNDTSYIYLGLAWSMLICASFCAFFSRWLALKSIKKLEQYVFELTGGKGLMVSDYRNLTKTMLGLTDAFVPLIFIGGVFGAWVLVIPALSLPLLVLVLVAMFFFRIGIRFSASRFNSIGKRGGVEEYIDSGAHKDFYRILMVSQYISVAIYILVATGLVGTMALIRFYLDDMQSLGWLPVVTAVALLQFKSFVSLVVRLGAYSSNISRVTQLIKNLSR